MDWCKSPIPEAIQIAKTRGVMFLVYVHGGDDQSEQMNAVWDSENVSKWVKETGCIAVRIQSASEECKFFSQIYPVVCVPSTYCIGDGGIPLEVIGGHMSTQEFMDKLKNAQENHESRKTSKNTVSAVSQGEQMDVSESPPEPSPGSSTASGTADSESLASGDQGETLSHSNKVERAKELIAKKQAEKAQKEFEKGREEEINRRKFGKDLHKLKQVQQETQMKELKEQMRKDKEEERKAKEKIRAQIARDREERASRFQKEKQERDAATEQAKKAKLVEEQQRAAAEEAKRSQTARIQVRLPDGSSLTQTFQSSDILQSLHGVVSERIGTAVTLSATFPKRVYNEDDLNSTFTELQLAPSAVLIALPQGRSGRQASSMATSSPGLSNIFSIVFYPFVLLWSFLSTLFFGGGGDQSNQQQQQSSQGGAWSSERSQRPNTAYQRGPERSRLQGNMRRLADMKDDDDDMSTYNGNSTQQM